MILRSVTNRTFFVDFFTYLMWVGKISNITKKRSMNWNNLDKVNKFITIIIYNWQQLIKMNRILFY